MKINENILIELDNKVSDYFVITKKISEKMNYINELEKKYLEEKIINKVSKDTLGSLKKETYLYQFYNVFLVKNIESIRLLYKLIKTNDIDILVLEGGKELEDKIIHIIESDPESLIVQGDDILIIDESLKDIIENKLTEVSSEELKKILKNDEKGK